MNPDNSPSLSDGIRSGNEPALPRPKCNTCGNSARLVRIMPRMDNVNLTHLWMHTCSCAWNEHIRQVMGELCQVMGEPDGR